MLEALGVAPSEEAIYETVLRHPGIRVAELGDKVEGSPSSVRRLLGSLEAKGLISRTVDKHPGYVAAPPRVAWEALILQRQEQLNRARLAAARYEELFRAIPQPRPVDLVEVVIGSEAVSQRFVQLQLGAQEEIMVFDKPPYAGTRNEVEFELLSRGIRYMGVYDPQGLTNRLTPVWEYIEAGEQARTHSRVPMKLVIIDRRVALIPLYSGAPRQIEGALLVYASSLVDALVVLWDTFWATSTEIGRSHELLDSAGPSLTERESRVVDLLLAGLTTQAIARQLGISKATLERDVSSILASVQAETRFQAAYKLGRMAERQASG